MKTIDFDKSLNNYLNRLGTHFPMKEIISSNSSVSDDRIPIDIWEDEDKLVVEAELPARDAANVHVILDKQTLSIEASRDSEEDFEGTYITKERYPGTVKRLINLPDEINTAVVTSRYHGGLLTVTLPKSEKAKAIKIEIE